MIKLTKLNGSPIMLNAELIETIEGSPDTVIALATGNRIIVKDTVDEVVAKVIEYRKKVNVESGTPNPIKGYKRDNP